MHGTFDAPGEERVAAREPTIARSDAFAILRRNLLLIIVVTLVGGVAAAGATTLMQKRYLAAARLVLERSDTRLSQPTAEMEQQNLDRSAVETEMDVIRSRSFAGDAVDRFGLMTDLNFNTYLAPMSGRFGIFDKIVGLVRGDGDLPEGAVPVGAAPPDSLPSVAVQRDRAITRLLDVMTVARVSAESLAMDLSVTSVDPKKAAELANGLAQLYADRSLRDKRAAVLNTIAFLHDRSEALASDISSDEIELSRFGAQHELADEQNVDLLRAQMVELNSQLTLARVDLADSEARLKQADIVVADDSEGFNTVVNSPLLAQLKADRSGIERDLQLLPQRHPARQRKEDEMAAVRGMIKAETDRILLELSNQVKVGRQRVDQLQNALDSLDKTNRERDVSQIRLQEMQRETNAKRARHDDILTRLGALERQGEALQPSARVVSMAEVPLLPVAPRPKLIVAAGVGGSFALAIVAILVGAGLDRRVRSAAALERRFGIPRLGYIPRINERRPLSTLFRFVKARPQSQVDEVMRSILWRCRITTRQEPNRIIMVASAVPGEGKSSVASALAAVAAKLGFATVLVDFDLRRHGATMMTSRRRGRRRGLFARPRPETFEGCSLQDYLAGNVDVVDDVLIAHPEVANLTIARSSCAQLQSNALFYTERVRNLFDTLAGRFDVVVVDTPPALLVNEAAELATWADFVLLVAAWGHTRLNEFGTCAEMFGELKQGRVGFVLNAVPMRAQRFYELPGAAIEFGRLAKGYYRS